jgi:hypothetical protein
MFLLLFSGRPKETRREGGGDVVARDEATRPNPPLTFTQGKHGVLVSGARSRNSIASAAASIVRRQGNPQPRDRGGQVWLSPGLRLSLVFAHHPLTCLPVSGMLSRVVARWRWWGHAFYNPIFARS